jgi:hypothetical protein
MAARQDSTTCIANVRHSYHERSSVPNWRYEDVPSPQQQQQQQRLTQVHCRVVAARACIAASRWPMVGAIQLAFFTALFRYSSAYVAATIWLSGFLQAAIGTQPAC